MLEVANDRSLTQHQIVFATSELLLVVLLKETPYSADILQAHWRVFDETASFVASVPPLGLKM